MCIVRRRRIFSDAPRDFGPVPPRLDDWAAWGDEADASVRIALVEARATPGAPPASPTRTARPVQAWRVGTSRFARKGGAL